MFWFSEYPNQIYLCHPVPKERRFAVVTDVGRDAAASGAQFARGRMALSAFAEASADWPIWPVEAFGVDGCEGKLANLGQRRAARLRTHVYLRCLKTEPEYARACISP